MWIIHIVKLRHGYWIGEYYFIRIWLKIMHANKTKLDQVEVLASSWISSGEVKITCSPNHEVEIM